MTKTPCAHLEALLPSMRDGDPPQYISGESAAMHTMNVWQAYTPQFSLDEFKNLILNFGFTDSWDQELLVSKYYYGMSAVKIAKEQNYVSHDSVSRRLRYLSAEFKRRGIKPKGSK